MGLLCPVNYGKKFVVGNIGPWSLILFEETAHKIAISPPIVKQMGELSFFDSLLFMDN
jgi:hypothetical protein